MSNRILPTEAAVILGVSPQYIRIAMQDNRLPIGSAVKMSSKWTYHISEKLLADYTGLDIKEELEKVRQKNIEKARRKEERCGRKGTNNYPPAG